MVDKNKTGRNDPCPCGSSKKYKNCCLNKDRARRIRESAWRSDEQVTLDKLIAFAQRPNLTPQLVVASNLFWNGNYGVEGLNALDRDEIRRFLDWYAYDYRLEGSMKRIIDLFVEEMGPTLLPAEQERARAWLDSYLGLYRITGLAQEGLLSVTDTLQDSAGLVLDNGLSRLGLGGDLILGRVLRSSDPPHFSWAAVLLPAEMEAGLVGFVTQGYKQYQETYTAASWPHFLSHSGYMFNHYLLNCAAEAGETRYAAKAHYDAFATLEKLRKAEKRLQEQAAKRAEELRKAAQPPTEEKVEPLRQTKGGVLLPSHVQYRGSKEVEG